MSEIFDLNKNIYQHQIKEILQIIEQILTSSTPSMNVLGETLSKLKPCLGYEKKQCCPLLGLVTLLTTYETKRISSFEDKIQQAFNYLLFRNVDQIQAQSFEAFIQQYEAYLMSTKNGRRLLEDLLSKITKTLRPTITIQLLELQAKQHHSTKQLELQTKALYEAFQLGLLTKKKSFRAFNFGVRACQMMSLVQFQKKSNTVIVAIRHQIQANAHTLLKNISQASKVYGLKVKAKDQKKDSDKQNKKQFLKKIFQRSKSKGRNHSHHFNHRDNQQIRLSYKEPSQAKNINDLSGKIQNSQLLINNSTNISVTKLTKSVAVKQTTSHHFFVKQEELSHSKFLIPQNNSSDIYSKIRTKMKTKSEMLPFHILLYEMYSICALRFTSEVKKKYFKDFRTELKEKLIREYPGRNIEHVLFEIELDKLKIHEMRKDAKWTENLLMKSGIIKINHQVSEKNTQQQEKIKVRSSSQHKGFKKAQNPKETKEIKASKKIKECVYYEINEFDESVSESVEVSRDNSSWMMGVKMKKDVNKFENINIKINQDEQIKSEIKQQIIRDQQDNENKISQKRDIQNNNESRSQQVFSNNIRSRKLSIKSTHEIGSKKQLTSINQLNQNNSSRLKQLEKSAKQIEQSISENENHTESTFKIRRRMMSTSKNNSSSKEITPKSTIQLLRENQNADKVTQTSILHKLKHSQNSKTKTALKKKVKQLIQEKKFIRHSENGQNKLDSLVLINQKISEQRDGNFITVERSENDCSGDQDQNIDEQIHQNIEDHQIIQLKNLFHRKQEEQYNDLMGHLQFLTQEQIDQLIRQYLEQCLVEKLINSNDEIQAIYNNCHQQETVEQDQSYYQVDQQNLLLQSEDNKILININLTPDEDSILYQNQDRPSQLLSCQNLINNEQQQHEQLPQFYHQWQEDLETINTDSQVNQLDNELYIDEETVMYFTKLYQQLINNTPQNQQHSSTQQQSPRLTIITAQQQQQHLHLLITEYLNQLYTNIFNNQAFYHYLEEELIADSKSFLNQFSKEDEINQDNSQEQQLLIWENITEQCLQFQREQQQKLAESIHQQTLQQTKQKPKNLVSIQQIPPTPSQSLILNKNQTSDTHILNFLTSISQLPINNNNNIEYQQQSSSLSKVNHNDVTTAVPQFISLQNQNRKNQQPIHQSFKQITSMIKQHLMNTNTLIPEPLNLSRKSIIRNDSKIKTKQMLPENTLPQSQLTKDSQSQENSSLATSHQVVTKPKSVKISPIPRQQTISTNRESHCIVISHHILKPQIKISQNCVMLTIFHPTEKKTCRVQRQFVRPINVKNYAKGLQSRVTKYLDAIIEQSLELTSHSLHTEHTSSVMSKQKLPHKKSSFLQESFHLSNTLAPSIINWDYIISQINTINLQPQLINLKNLKIEYKKDQYLTACLMHYIDHQRIIVEYKKNSIDLRPVQISVELNETIDEIRALFNEKNVKIGLIDTNNQIKPTLQVYNLWCHLQTIPISLKNSTSKLKSLFRLYQFVFKTKEGHTRYNMLIRMVQAEGKTENIILSDIGLEDRNKLINNLSIVVGYAVKIQDGRVKFFVSGKQIKEFLNVI